MKEEGVSVIAVKFEFLVKVSFEQTYQYFPFLQCDPVLNPLWSEVNYYSDGEDSSLSTHFIVHLLSAMVPPFGDRDIALQCSYHRHSEDSMIYLVQNANSFPLTKKRIRAYSHLCGMLIKSIIPSSTLITHIVQGDAKGAMPKCKKMMEFFSGIFINALKKGL